MNIKDIFIKKRPKDDNYYSELQSRTLKRLGELSGKIWTDFNAHDPGITISDYLNYALYDLHYRLQFPFEAYLFSAEDEKEYSEKGLLPRNELFTEYSREHDKEIPRKSIVTEEDYEHFILNTHKELIEKCVVRLNQSTWKYDFFIKPKDEKTNETEIRQLEESVKRTYHRHRNLGEDMDRICYDWKELDKKDLYKRRRPVKTNVYEFPEFDDAPSEQTPTPPFFSTDYQSIQNDFPENYGIGERGIPNKNSSDYPIKVLQLKAYLLIFDILMADQLQQAKNVKTLFALSADMPDVFIPDVTIVEHEKIVDYEKKKHVALREKDFYHKQKFRFLNMLDVLYGEDTRTLFGKKDIAALNGKRGDLLRYLPKLNEYRFRSFDIYEPNSSPAVQQLMETISQEQHEICTGNRRHGVQIISDVDFFDRYRFLLGSYIDLLPEQISLNDIPEKDIRYDEKVHHTLHMHMNLVWYGVFFESLLKYGTDPANYKILSFPKNQEHLLVFFHPEKKIGINMSLYFSDKEKLIEMTNLFRAFIRKINEEGHRQSIYFIEHILLTSAPTEEYDRISIIVPERKSDASSDSFEKQLRERLPAHLRISLYYLKPKATEHFHSVYFNWRKALATQNPAETAYYSGSVNTFLNHADNPPVKI